MVNLRNRYYGLYVATYNEGGINKKEKLAILSKLDELPKNPTENVDNVFITILLVAEDTVAAYTYFLSLFEDPTDEFKQKWDERMKVIESDSPPITRFDVICKSMLKGFAAVADAEHIPVEEVTKMKSAADQIITARADDITKLANLLSEDEATQLD